MGKGGSAHPKPAADCGPMAGILISPEGKRIFRREKGGQRKNVVFLCSIPSISWWGDKKIRF